MSKLTKSLSRSSRFAMLMLALVVPCGTPAIAQSLMSLETETETATEQCKECVSVASAAQSRKRQLAVRRLDADPFACQTGQLHSRDQCRGISGHRLSHEQLAPLRC